MSDGKIIIDTLLDTDGLEKGTNSLGSVASGGLKIFGAAVIGASVALGGLGIASLKLASNLGEVQNIVDTTFGDNASKINEWAKSADTAFGLSELQAKQFTGTLGAMLKSMGLTGDAVLTMSEGMTGLAGDMSSFYNIPIEDALIKIRAGLSGETEPLKQLGINMSVANLNAYALAQGLGKTYDSMSQAEQATLRYNYLMSVTKDTQGDFAKTSGSLANQMRIASLNVKSLGTDIGSILLPVAQDAIQKFNGIAEKLRDALANPEIQASIKKLATMIGELVTGALKFLVDHLDDVIKGLTWVIDNAPLIAAGITSIATTLAVIKVAGAIGFIVGIFTKLFEEIAKGKSVMAALNIAVGLNPFVLIAAAIAALVVGFIVLWNTSEDFRNFWIGIWENIKLAFSDAWNAIINFFTKTIPEAFNSVLDFFAGVGDWFGQLWEDIKQSFVDTWNEIIDFFVGVSEWFGEMWDTIKQTFIDGWNVIANFFTTTIPAWIDSITAWFEALPRNIGYILGTLAALFMKGLNIIWNIITVTIPAIINSIVTWFAQLPSLIWTWLVGVVTNIALWGSQVYTTVATWIGATITSIGTWFASLPGIIWAWLVQVATDIGTWGLNIYTTATAWIGNTIDSIISWFSQLPGRIWDWLTQTISNIVQWGNDMFSKGTSAASDLVSGIVDTISSLPGKMLEIGTNIVKGIWNGISDGAGWLMDKVGNFCSDVVSGFMGGFKEHSPSRIMRDLVGVNLVKGIGVGIDLEAPNLDKDILSYTSGLSAKMKGAVDYNIASTTARVVAQNNFSIAKENQTTDTSSTDNKGKGDLIIVLEQDGRETARAIAPHQDILNAWGDGR